MSAFTHRGGRLHVCSRVYEILWSMPSTLQLENKSAKYSTRSAHPAPRMRSKPMSTDGVRLPREVRVTILHVPLSAPFRCPARPCPTMYGRKESGIGPVCTTELATLFPAIVFLNREYATRPASSAPSPLPRARPQESGAIWKQDTP